jgi:hypothetical protein
MVSTEISRASRHTHYNPCKIKFVDAHKRISSNSEGYEHIRQSMMTANSDIWNSCTPRSRNRQHVDQSIGWKKTTKATAGPPFIHFKPLEIQHRAADDRQALRSHQIVVVGVTKP